MSLNSYRPAVTSKRSSSLLLVIATGLLASACSAGGSLENVTGLLGSSQQSAAAGSDRGDNASPAPQTDMEKAIAYWGEEHKKKPHDLNAALAYSKNLKAAGHKEQAFGVLQNAALLHGDSKELASEMGRLALEFDQVGIAEKLLAAADDPAKPDWRIISARGTVLAKQSKFAEAIPMFERALQLAPNRPSLLNNLAMAHAANGNPAKAEEILRRAASSSNDPKVKQNLALVLGLQGKHDEAGTARAGTAPPETAAADNEYIKRMVKATPATTPAQAMPALATTPAPAATTGAPVMRAAAPRQNRPEAQQQPRVIEAKAAARPAAKKDGLRPASGPSAGDSPAGGWSTSVTAAR